MTIKKLLALISLVAVMAASAAFAQPPSDMTLSWNGAESALSVSAAHQVNDRTKHFIMTLIVKDGDGKQLLMKRYTEQPTNAGFSDKVTLNGVKPGTKLTVELTCNIMGSLAKDITIN